MTETEWAASSDPGAMLFFLASPSEVGRKMRLFAAAVARDGLERRRSSNAHDDADDVEFEAAIARVEAYADGRGELRYDQTFFKIEWYDDFEAACSVLGYDPDASTWLFYPAEYIGRYRVNPAHWLRDIFGNPFCPVALDPRWRTSDVVGVARGIYEDWAFDRLPILADALMDAGCENEQIIGHCRSDSPHVRGCWVVDLVLGNE